MKPAIVIALAAALAACGGMVAQAPGDSGAPDARADAPSDAGDALDAGTSLEADAPDVAVDADGAPSSPLVCWTPDGVTTTCGEGFYCSAPSAGVIGCGTNACQPGWACDPTAGDPADHLGAGVVCVLGGDPNAGGCP